MHFLPVYRPYFLAMRGKNCFCAFIGVAVSREIVELYFFLDCCGLKYSLKKMIHGLRGCLNYSLMNQKSVKME